MRQTLLDWLTQCPDPHRSRRHVVAKHALPQLIQWQNNIRVVAAWLFKETVALACRPFHSCTSRKLEVDSNSLLGCGSFPGPLDPIYRRFAHACRVWPPLPPKCPTYQAHPQAPPSNPKPRTSPIVVGAPVQSPSHFKTFMTIASFTSVHHVEDETVSFNCFMNILQQL